MKTTAEIPIGCSTPLWHGDQLVGFIDIRSCDRGTITAILRPGPAFERDRHLFEDAVAADQSLAQCGLREYQAAWRAWKQACQRLQQLELSFGELHIPIEEFAIDAAWRVEFETALWWDVMLTPNHAAVKSGSRWR